METSVIKRLTGKVGHLVDYPGQADNGPAEFRRVAILAGHVQNSYQEDWMSVRARTRSQPEPGPLSEPVLTDIVRRVVEVARPQRIVMFGSAARGTARADSDVDLLVVKSGRFQRGRLVDAIYRNLRGAGAPVDVIVVTPEEVERYRNDPCLIIAPALKEGKVVYAA
jgi:predicted nucleotidyltransferase